MVRTVENMKQTTVTIRLKNNSTRVFNSLQDYDRFRQLYENEFYRVEIKSPYKGINRTFVYDKSKEEKI